MSYILRCAVEQAAFRECSISPNFKGKSDTSTNLLTLILALERSFNSFSACYLRKLTVEPPFWGEAFFARWRSRRHFKGLGAEAEAPSWADSGIGPNPVEDGSFAEAWAALVPEGCGRG